MNNEKEKCIAFVIAMEEEFLEFINKYENKFIFLESSFNYLCKANIFNKNIVVVCSGIGVINASRATQFLIDNYNIELLINTGVVGLLNEKIFNNNIFIVEDFFHYEYSLDMSDNSLLGKYKNFNTIYIKNNTPNNIKKIIQNMYTPVRCATGDKFINSTNFKNKLVNTYKCDICDMEGFAINYICKLNNIKNIFIKSVSDLADENANISFLEIIKNNISFYIKIIEKIIKNIK